MKFRKGFVTNSSSSSFVLAKKNNVDKTNLWKEIFNRPVLDSILDEAEYYTLPTEVENALNVNDKGTARVKLCDYILEQLLNYSPDMNLDDWLISFGEVSNESMDPVDLFLFDESIDFSDIKIQTNY